MRVLLAGGPQQKGEHSMMGFVERLAPALRAAGIDAKAVHADPVNWAANVQSAKIRKYANYIETYFRYPKRLRREAREADVVHITDQGLAHLLRDQTKPAVVTIHDLLAVRASLGEFDYWHIGPSGQAQQGIIRSSLSLARRAACVSSKTKEDVERLLPGLKAQVIYNALFSDFRGLPALEREPFFFCVGGNQPYKNREGIVRVAGQLLQRSEFSGYRFKIVGRTPDEALDEAIRASGIAGRVDQVIDPSHEKLGAIYRSAEGLLFLSREEGFGLPILEAQSAGCWVVTMDKEPMREVAGEGATRVPEGAEADAIAAAHPHRGAVIAKGWKNLDRFSVQAMASEYADLYRGVAA